jgi:hypothetical protein
LTSDEKNGKTQEDAIQKAFEEGLEQGYWVGRMISEALDRNNSNEQSHKPTEELPPFMQQIIDITREKGVEFD